MNQKIKSGDTLYRMSQKGIEPVIVEKVGNKYFHIKGDPPFKKYDIETLTYRDRKEYICRAEVLYMSEQEIADMKEYDELMSMIQKAFSNYNTPQNLKLKDLREIKAIIFKQ